MKAEYKLENIINQKTISIGGINLSNLITITIEGLPSDVFKVIATLEKDWVLS